MWDYLDGTPQEISSPFFADDRAVDLTRGNIGVCGKVNIDEALVVTQIEVGLGTILGNEYFAMLVGRHCAWVNIEVRV